ncbi:MAG: hypothetical protein K6T73_06990 [Candidatus Bathyarchaeota archaeon]|nr:hypothetical protein [Candidatus Bathyarchaeota archaeon]
MSEERLYMFDVAALFHCLLFAYQKNVEKILGSGSAIFIHPTLELLAKIDMKRGLNLIRGKGVEETWDNLSSFFLKSSVVKEFSFRKVDAERFVLRVDGCVWARHVHGELEPKDVPCPLALVAMAAFEKMSGKKVRVADSEYFEEGTETVIEPA